jgi:hypothetical protein
MEGMERERSINWYLGDISTIEPGLLKALLHLGEGGDGVADRPHGLDLHRSVKLEPLLHSHERVEDVETIRDM